MTLPTRVCDGSHVSRLGKAGLARRDGVEPLQRSALGAFAEGRRYGEKALRLATLTGPVEPLILAYSRLSLLYLAQGGLEDAIRVCNQGLALCRTSGKWLFPNDRGVPGLCLCAPGTSRG